MLTINDRHYSKDDFAQLEKRFLSLDLLKNQHCAVALCIEDTATWLALCFFMRKHRLSVLPIHPSTPLETSKQWALKAGCTQLYYKDMAAAIHLSPNKTREDSVAPGLIQMSSGTTGEPKYIQRSWQDIEVEIASYIETFSKAESMTPVVACPVTHSYGLICGVMVALARQQQPIVVTNINPKYLLKILLDTERPLLYSSPTMLQGLIRFWPEEKKLHGAMTSGTMMSQATLDELSCQITFLFQQYGCSEAGCVSINQNMTHTQDMGTPLPHLEVSCDGTTQQPGDIIVRPKNQRNKVINTQDLGYLKKSELGIQQLHFVARQDDTIIVAGLNVYPQQVEDIMLQHQDIDDALVFKIEDPYAGQRVGIQFVASKELNISELRQWCTQHLADFQRPYHFKQVEKIQRMANGKVNRKNLGQAFLQQKTRPGISPNQRASSPA